jgi:hypothetical protein
MSLEEEMKISLTKQEYQLLLDMLYIANWVITAHRVGEDPQTQPYEGLEQKLFSFAKEAGYENLVHYDEKFGQYFPTRELEEQSLARSLIDEYDNDSFWEELAARLATRDVARRLGGFDKLAALRPMERIEKLGTREDYYNAEFVVNGLDNLRLVKPGPKSRGFKRSKLQ